MLNEMTAEELIAYVEYALPKRNPDSILDALYNRLKEAITPNPDEIHIVWSVDDVYIQAEMLGVQPTLEQAREVLRRVDESWDAETGVTWSDIAYNLTDVLEGR